jgi:hypothetical protein
MVRIPSLGNKPRVRRRTKTQNVFSLNLSRKGFPHVNLEASMNDESTGIISS